MTTFDRFIVKRIVVGFVALVCMLILFFIALHYVEYMDDFFDRGVPTREVFAVYYPSYVPEIIMLTAPLALFLSAIFVTTQLSQQLQIAVLMTSGVSIYRLLLPYALLGCLVTGFMFWFNGWIVPESNGTRIQYELRYFKDQHEGRSTRNLHYQESPNSILTTGYFDRRSDTAYEVSLQRFDADNRIEERIDAREMQWVDSLKTWRMFEVIRRRFDADGEIVRIRTVLLDTTLNVLPRDLRRTDRDVELQTIPEAKAYLESLKRSGASNTGRPTVEYWSKFTYPLANLILILLALPLAAVRRPGGQAVQMGIGLGLAFLYLVTQQLAEPMGYSESIPPLVASVAPHLIFGALAVYLLLRART